MPQHAFFIRLDLRSLIHEELFRTCSSLYQLSWRHPQQFHEHAHLVLLVLAWEQGASLVEFDEDAAHGPHINGSSVGDSENDLGGPIEPALNIGIDLLV